MNSNVFESAKKVLNDLTCPRCKNYSFCHNGTDDQMKSCIYLSVYLAGYKDAVDYFESTLSHKSYNTNNNVRCKNE